MLFIALGSIKPTYTPARSMQIREEFKLPQGVKRVAEYWLQTHSPHVISIYEASDISQLMAMALPWLEILDISVFPASTIEEGQKIADQLMART